MKAEAVQARKIRPECRLRAELLDDLSVYCYFQPVGSEVERDKLILAYREGPEGPRECPGVYRRPFEVKESVWVWRRRRGRGGEKNESIGGG